MSFWRTHQNTIVLGAGFAVAIAMLITIRQGGLRPDDVAPAAHATVAVADADADAATVAAPGSEDAPAAQDLALLDVPELGPELGPDLQPERVTEPAAREAEALVAVAADEATPELEHDFSAVEAGRAPARAMTIESVGPEGLPAKMVAALAAKRPGGRRGLDPDLMAMGMADAVRDAGPLDPFARAPAIDVEGGLGTDESVIDALDDRLESAFRAELDRLVCRIRHSDVEAERIAAMEALREVGPPAYGYALPLLHEADGMSRLLGILILREVEGMRLEERPAALPRRELLDRLVSCLDDEDGQVRFHADLALRTLTKQGVDYFHESLPNERGAAIRCWQDRIANLYASQGEQ